MSDVKSETWPSWLAKYVIEPLPSVSAAIVFSRSTGAELGRSERTSGSASGVKPAELQKLDQFFLAPKKSARAAPTNSTASARSAREGGQGDGAATLLNGDVRTISEHDGTRIKGEGFVAVACGPAHAMLLLSAKPALDFEVVGLAEKNSALIAKHAPNVPPPPDWALEVLALSKPAPAPPKKKTQTAVSVQRSEAPRAPATAATVSGVGVPCDGCRRLIDIGREAHLKTSVGGLFHPGCLVCSTCSTPLSGAYAIDDDGRAKCAKCQPTCDVCRQPLRGTYLLLDDGRSVHQECAPQHPCDGCGGNIDAGVPFMTAKNKEFHKGCMKCEMCHKAINEYADVDGAKIVCLACANQYDFDGRGASSGGGAGGGAIDTSADTGVYCHACRQMIGVGKFVRCLDRKYHTACLKCVMCRSVLGPEDDIFNKGGDPACANCGKYKD